MTDAGLATGTTPIITGGSDTDLALYLSGVHRLLLLVLIFLLTAGLYLLYDFYFLGLAYVIVYSGAIAIIFLFVL